MNMHIPPPPPSAGWGCSTKSFTVGLYPDVQPHALLYTILTDEVPFSHIHSYLACIINRSSKKEVSPCHFHVIPNKLTDTVIGTSVQNILSYTVRPFKITKNERFSHIPQLVKSLSFYIPEA